MVTTSDVIRIIVDKRLGLVENKNIPDLAILTNLLKTLEPFLEANKKLFIFRPFMNVSLSSP